MILHTTVLGNGEPLVFLHTGLQTGATDFLYQRDYFKGSYKVILPDLRGHGFSPNTDLSNFFEDSAHDLVETLNQLEADAIHIVGCSLGALVGLVFAKRFPEKVRSLTLSGILSERPSNWSELHKEDVKSQSELLRNDSAVEYFDSIHKADWRNSLALAKDENWYPFQETKDLDGISSPVLYMVGEGNRTETKGALTYPSMQKNVHVSIIPFASHLVHSDQPELYSKILEKFLTSVDHD